MPRSPEQEAGEIAMGPGPLEEKYAKIGELQKLHPDDSGVADWISALDDQAEADSMKGMMELEEAKPAPESTGGPPEVTGDTEPIDTKDSVKTSPEVSPEERGNLGPGSQDTSRRPDLPNREK